MSYEGYTQLLCANGHYAAPDCHDEEPPVCRRCGAPWVWQNNVDVTNGSYDEEAGTCTDGHVELERRCCPTCGQDTDTYWIPAELGRPGLLNGEGRS